MLNSELSKSHKFKYFIFTDFKHRLLAGVIESDKCNPEYIRNINRETKLDDDKIFTEKFIVSSIDINIGSGGYGMFINGLYGLICQSTNTTPTKSCYYIESELECCNKRYDCYVSIDDEDKFEKMLNQLVATMNRNVVTIYLNPTIVKRPTPNNEGIVFATHKLDGECLTATLILNHDINFVQRYNQQCSNIENLININIYHDMRHNEYVLFQETNPGLHNGKVLVFEDVCKALVDSTSGETYNCNQPNHVLNP